MKILFNSIPQSNLQNSTFVLAPRYVTPPYKKEDRSMQLSLMMSLIYVEKLKFEITAIMEDKQCKQTDRFSIIAKGSNYFLSLDDKSKQRYKVKINYKGMTLIR